MANDGKTRRTQGLGTLAALLIAVSLTACGGGSSGGGEGGGSSSGGGSSGGGSPNQPPTIGNFAIAPKNAFTDTPLDTALEASDPDGTQLDESYVWQVNGEVVEGETEARLDHQYFVKGDTVSVEVTVSDGELAAEESANTIIQDSPPEITVLGMPETIDYGVEASFRILIEDADGDPFTWNFLARPNGMERDESGLVTWTPTGPMFDTRMDVNWEISVRQGDEHYPAAGSITVVDGNRQIPLAGGFFTIGRATAGDFNGDGVQEVLATDGNKRLYTVESLGGDYRITWEYPYAFIRENAHISSIAAADLDGDGTDEMLVGVEADYYRTQESTSLFVLGSDRRPELAATVEGNQIQRIRVADVDNDGAAELVLLIDVNASWPEEPEDFENQKRLAILDGADFSLKWQSPILQLGDNLAVGDVDGDPVQEIALANGHLFGFDGEGYAIEWERNEGFTINNSYTALDIGDLDGDGIGEIIGVIGDYPDTHLTAFNAIDREVKAQNPVQTQNLVTFDVDGDGTVEILTTESGVGRGQLYAFDAAASPQFVAQWTSRPSPWGENMLIANLDSDAALEFFYPNRNDIKVYSDLSGDGNPGLEWQSTQPKYIYRELIDAGQADFREEGLAAIAWSTIGNEGAYLMLMDPQSGGISWSAEIPTVSEAETAAALVDLQQDATMDLLYVSKSTPGIYNFFSESVVWSGDDTGSEAVAIAQGDLNGDAGIDMVFTTGDGGIRAYDTETFQLLWSHPSGGGVDIRVADLGGDGREEVVVAGEQSVGLLTADDAYSAMSPIFSLADVPEDMRGTTYSNRLDSLEVTQVAVGDLDGDSRKEITLSVFSSTYIDSWVIVLNSDFTLRSFTAYPDTAIRSVQIQDYGTSARNILLNAQSGRDYYAHYFVEVDPDSGKVVSESPVFNTGAIPGAMKFVDTDGDGIPQVNWLSRFGRST